MGDEEINGYVAVVKEKDAEIDAHRVAIAKKDGEIENLQQQLANTNDIIESLRIQTKKYDNGKVYIGQMKDGKWIIQTLTLLTVVIMLVHVHYRIDTRICPVTKKYSAIVTMQAHYYVLCTMLALLVLVVMMYGFLVGQLG